MTDKDIILNYINTNYEIYYEEHKSNSGTNIILGTRNKSTKKYSDVTNLTNEVKLLYGDFISDEGELVSDYINNWFEIEKKEYFKEIYDKLSELEVNMGDTNWIVSYKNNEPFKFDDLEPIWVKHDSKELISKIYNDWLMLQVEAISQKIMGINS
tara:strand:+ start:749 stop:1213 length:465 start_codon:yes stop_codon:yes gene_type:complete